MYKELPPKSETENYFKAGDHIRGFNCGPTGDYSWEMKVSRVEGNMVIDVDGSKSHFKQCRLLEEVKPREWTVYRIDVGREIISSNKAARFMGVDLTDNRWETIKVREILDE